MKFTFVAGINGRVQTPVVEYLKRALKADFVDMITEPGARGVLAERKDGSVVASLKHKGELSILRHGARVVAVAGHHDCAGYPGGGRSTRSRSWPGGRSSAPGTRKSGSCSPGSSKTGA